MKSLRMSLLALAVVAQAAAPAAAQCANGVCGVLRGAGSRIVRVVRVREWHAGHGHAGHNHGGLLSNTRFRDGDGRPLRRAR